MVRQLLANIKRALPKLEKLLEEANDHWVYEDGVYRFYHGSWKVFHLEGQTLAIVDALASLAPLRIAKVSSRWLRTRERQTGGPLNPWFMRIIAEGTGKTFKRADNEHWLEVTRPIVEAFFHAHYFLQMVVKYGNELKEAPAMLPSGWAAVLYLYNTR